MPIGGLSIAAITVLLVWCGRFGFLLDRYAANSWPTPGRLWIIAARTLGSVPYMLADMMLTGNAGLGKRILVRMAFLVSLGIAVALDFSGLFFLIMIAPVLVLFYLVCGMMGRDVAARVGLLAPGLALGVALAWPLGVSFPLFNGI